MWKKKILCSTIADLDSARARLFARMRITLREKLAAMAGVFLRLLLPWLLMAEVYCQQTIPYVSFMGQTLANHSYVDISQVGTGDETVQCHTDLATCCTMAQGPHRGNWYFPNGTRLPFPGGGDTILLARQAQRVELRRTVSTAMEPTGIYRCDIETEAVHDNGMNETVYVGLYTSDGSKVLSLFIHLALAMLEIMISYNYTLRVLGIAA